MIMIFILIPFLVLVCSVISVLIASHFLGYDLTAAVGILALVIMVMSLIVGIALGISTSRKDYIEALQDFYDRMRDVPERARGLSIKAARDALFTAAIFDLKPPLPNGFMTEREFHEKKNVHKSINGGSGGGEGGTMMGV